MNGDPTPSQTVVTGALQVALVILVAPLLLGITKRVKARLQYRRGPALLQPYRDLVKPLADKLAKNEFVIGAADTIGEEVAIAKEGLVTALVGQRPFEMGYKAPSVMLDLIAGKPVEDPVFTGLDECTKDTADTCIQK